MCCKCRSASCRDRSVRSNTQYRSWHPSATPMSASLSSGLPSLWLWGSGLKDLFVLNHINHIGICNVWHRAHQCELFVPLPNHFTHVSLHLLMLHAPLGVLNKLQSAAWCLKNKQCRSPRQRWDWTYHCFVPTFSWNPNQWSQISTSSGSNFKENITTETGIRQTSLHF